MPYSTPSERPHASKPDEFWLCISPGLRTIRNMTWPPGTSMCPEPAPQLLMHCQYLVPSLRVPQPKQATAWPPPSPVSLAVLPMYTFPAASVPSRSWALKLSWTLKEQVNAPYCAMAAITFASVPKRNMAWRPVDAMVGPRPLWRWKVFDEPETHEVRHGVACWQRPV